MSEDWIEEEKPKALALHPCPSDLASRLKLVEKCWIQLSPEQKTFLAAYRECGFNARKTERKLGHPEERRSHRRWREEKPYATILKVWMRMGADDALDKDRLLARQDEIVETLLDPREVVVDGQVLTLQPDAGALSAASRANEVLLDRASPKPRADVEVNVGVSFAPVQVEIEQPAGAVIDATAEVVESGPAFPPEQDWLYEDSSDSGEVLQRQ